MCLNYANAKFKYIAILVAVVAKSFHSNANEMKRRNKSGAQQHLYAIPYAALRIFKPLNPT